MEKIKINYSTDPAKIKNCTMKFNEGLCTQVMFPDGTVRNADELEKIVNCFKAEEQRRSAAAEVVKNESLPAVVIDNKPAVKMSFAQAAKFVFGGKEGTMIDRLNKIKEMALPEMTEEEKKGAESIMAGFKKMTEK